MAEDFYTKELANGMVLLGERMEHVSSAAMTFLVPAGSSHDLDEGSGAASVLCEWSLRGAGDRDTRQLNDALDSLGCQHNESVESEHIHLTAAQLGRNLPEVVKICADILRRPRLEHATFAPCRALVGQDLAALEDEPANKCNLLLRERFYPYPLGRCIYGRNESLERMTPDAVRKQWEGDFGPRGTIVAAAGNIDWDQFCDLMVDAFGDWDSPQRDPVRVREADGGVTYITKQTAQVHIAIAHKSATPSHSAYYPARVAEAVLSGGMSGRLLTEVREKRGLVYAVASRYHSLKDHAGMFTYLATTPQRAQETLEVTVNELRRLGEGVTEEEIARARTQLKTAVVMQGESTIARSGALGGDWYILHRLRSLQELSDAIDSVKADDVMGYLEEFPADGFTVLGIGPEPLDFSGIAQ